MAASPSKAKQRKAMKIDIVCPLYRADEFINGLLVRLKNQTDVEIVHAVFPITDTGDTKMVEQAIEQAGYEFFLVDKADFSHSLTRQRAIKEYCESDVVVCLSQDVILINQDSLFQLASAICLPVAFAYGRQICSTKTIEHYIREKNYSDRSECVSLADVGRLQLHAFFASDAFSAYHRPTFLHLGGYDDVHMMMSEDMYYAKKIIEAGYVKQYVAEAVVEHSHKFTLKQLYKRYFDTGVWFAEHPEFDEYKTTNSGLQLAIYVFFAALKDINIPVLFRWLPDMTVRYLGMKQGKRSKKRKAKKA